MGASVEEYEGALDDLKQHEDDSGSAVVQVIQLTERIDNLTEHLREHPQDHSCRKGLRTLIGKRDRQLDYLQDKDYDQYAEVVERLDL